MQRYTYFGWQDTIVSGWGTVSSILSISSLPAVLQWAKVPPVSDATCTQAYSFAAAWSADKTICTGLHFLELVFRSQDNPLFQNLE